MGVMKFQPFESQSFLSVGTYSRADAKWVSPTSYPQSLPTPEAGLSSVRGSAGNSSISAKLPPLQRPAHLPPDLSSLLLATSLSPGDLQLPLPNSLPPTFSSPTRQPERSYRSGTSDSCLLPYSYVIPAHLPSGQSPDSLGVLQTFSGSCLSP